MPGFVSSLWRLERLSKSGGSRCRSRTSAKHTRNDRGRGVEPESDCSRVRYRFGCIGRTKSTHTDKRVAALGVDEGAAEVPDVGDEVDDGEAGGEGGRDGPGVDDAADTDCHHYR